ncbi:YceI family protein [Rhodobacteraceae bacterium F11138]|nr:YceI family protein [Rhodobacteraceae bacterium F11138]
MKTKLAAIAMIAAASAATAAPEVYTMDPSHSQVAFSYGHGDFSTTYWILSGFEGEIVFDAQNPAASRVTTSIPVERLLTGWQERSDHVLKSGDFFDVEANPTVRFESTGIEVTGDKTALISGDVTINGVTVPVVLDAHMTAMTDQYPLPPFSGKPAIGVSATTTLLRSDFDLGMFAPFVSDQVEVEISIEAMQLQ